MDDKSLDTKLKKIFSIISRRWWCSQCALTFPGLFFFVLFFSINNSKTDFVLNFANDWIQTAFSLYLAKVIEMFHSRPFFFIWIFSTGISKTYSVLNFVNYWFRTADLWLWKWPLWRMSHKVCIKNHRDRSSSNKVLLYKNFTKAKHLLGWDRVLLTRQTYHWVEILVC